MHMHNRGVYIIMLAMALFSRVIWMKTRQWLVFYLVWSLCLPNVFMSGCYFVVHTYSKLCITSTIELSRYSAIMIECRSQGGTLYLVEFYLSGVFEGKIFYNLLKKSFDLVNK